MKPDIQKAIEYCDKKGIKYSYNERESGYDDISIYLDGMRFNCATVKDIKDAINF